MNRILFTLLAVSLFLASCIEGKSPDPKILETNGIAAQGPYLTEDHEGKAVLCWTEQGSDSLNMLKYAVYDVNTEAFGPAVTVAPSAGCSAAAESMAKVAFKKDGTAIAVFAKRFVNEKNPYAGAIYYSVSTDSGKSWSDATYLHSDTSHFYGRSFFDIARLKDGELAAVWLDGRFAKSIKGSALFFSRTAKGAGFIGDTCLDKGTCECCRTDLLTDDNGNIHLAYRSILFPDPLSGKQVRDMVYSYSSDNGKTFSKPELISNDNWEIEGCPHSGPSIALRGNTTDVVWFTAAGGNAGLYSSSAKAGTAKFSRRNLVTNSGRHPQIIALPDDKMVMAYEEMPAEPEEHAHAHHTADAPVKNAKGMMKHGPAPAAKVVLRVVENDNPPRILELSNGQQSDNHAVLTKIGNEVLVAWVREADSGSKIYYRKVKL